MAHDEIVRLRPPPGVLEIADRLERAGHPTWCVGGAVRDALLGHPPLDWDLATAATPDEVRKLFRRSVPVGIEFGTVGVFDSHGVMHEVTTLRRDVRTDGRKAVVEFGASLDDDLARRDFTINAIAYSPEHSTVHDPFGGRDDLARRILRAVGDPPTRMREDRLRALRAIRFAARYSLTIDDATWNAISESAPHLTRLSAERVREELEKTMSQVRRPSSALEQWRASGALGVLVPALASAPAIRFATVDCLAMAGLTTRPQRGWLRIAALWLDEEPGAADRALRALRYSNAQVRWTVEIVERWQRLASEFSRVSRGDSVSDVTLRQWAAIAGRTRLAALLRLAAARAAAEGDASGAGWRSLYRRAVRVAYGHAIEIADLAVDGTDLVQHVGATGPAIGTILRQLLDLVVADPSRNTRDDLLARARELHAAG